MRITGWRVDGYGVLADQVVEDLPEGMTVVHGPNEAGKSTLLAFVRHVLFGFPDRRQREELRPALRGGRHGGALYLADGEGSYVLERHVDTRRAVLTLPDGSAGSEQSLARLLGEADAGLFRSVFAFGLDELASLSSLDADEVRDRVFSAGVLGAGRSASRAIRTLDQRAAELVRPRKGDARANALQARLGEIELSLRSAREQARGYPQAAAECSRLEGELSSARAELERLRERLGELDLLISCWPPAHRLACASEQLAARPPSLHDASLLELSDEVRRLAGERSGYDAGQRRREKLCGELGELERRLAERRRGLRGIVGAELLTSEGLDGLGLDADAESSAVRSCSERRSAAALHDERVDEHVAGSRALEAAERSLRQLEAEGERPRSLDELRRQLGALFELRRWLSEQDALESAARDRSREERLAALAARSPAGSPLIAALLAGLAALLAVAAVIAGRSGSALAAGLSAAVAVALAALAARLGRSRRTAARRGAEAAGGEEPGALGRCREEVARLACALGLREDPLIPEVESLGDRLALELERRRELEQAGERVDQARRVERAASRRLDEAAARVARVDSELSRLASRLGATTTAPDLLPAAVRSLVEASALEAERRRLAFELEEVESSLAHYRAEVVAVVEKLSDGESFFVGGPQSIAALCELERACELALERSRERLALERAASEAAEHLELALGSGAAARRLRAELAGGDKLSWCEERERLARELEASEARFETLLSEQALAHQRLEQLRSSATIAALELERNSVAADLAAVLRQWATLGLARVLLERTLARYEQERQPLVVRRAAELFAEVTDGRYVQLVAREDPDGGRGRGMDVVAAGGSRLDVGQLSRGTAEQLYLCLRLALAASFAERSASLPLLLDDVLVNFDPERAAAVARALSRTAEEHQVLAFTCHPGDLELLCRATPGCRIVPLERQG